MYHDSVCIAENIVVLLLFQKRRSSCLPFPMAFLRARARASTHPHTHAQIPTHSRTYTPPHKYRALFGYLHDVLLLTLDLVTTTELCADLAVHTSILVMLADFCRGLFACARMCMWLSRARRGGCGSRA